MDCDLGEDVGRTPLSSRGMVEHLYLAEGATLEGFKELRAVTVGEDTVYFRRAPAKVCTFFYFLFSPSL